MNAFNVRLMTAALLLAPAARAQTNGLDVNIRSGVDRAEQARRAKDPGYAQDASKRKRLYFLAHIRWENNGKNLEKPVDANAMAKQVNDVLQAQGFHPVKPGQIPDVVITVVYGRGVPPNPLLNPREPGRPYLSDSPINSVFPDQKQYVGREEKIQRVRNQEKLMIEVRAWEYPPPKDPKKMEKLVWLTTMYVDDPDHRDLNEISAKMLADGAPYFDHHLDRENEVLIRNPPPDGHVKVGSPEVVPEAK